MVRNLALLDEDRLDFDLLEDLVAHIDESQEGQEGAILVFLPGGRWAAQAAHVVKAGRRGAAALAAGGESAPQLLTAALRCAVLRNAGMGEIQELQDRLTASRRFREGSAWVIPLHSTVSPK